MDRVILFMCEMWFSFAKWTYNLQNIRFGALYTYESVNISRLIFFLTFVAEFRTMYKIFRIVLMFNLLASSILAQEQEPTEIESLIYKQLFYREAQGGKVCIIQEEKLDEVLLLFMEQNRKLGGIPCYWIRIYSGSAHNSREEAYETKARFLSKYEGIRNDVIYDNPNFKVYIGGYRSKSETLKLLNRIKRHFPTAFIVYDIIDFPEK